MGRLKPVTHKELIRKLRKFGFEGPYSGGKQANIKREEWENSE
ncbi:MAG TPA: hypothetical protein P5253_01580 [bacterium]|jgi:hypothetical protein|nr:hypothetical protein [bacterium]HRU32831.1 hypothetical protein [bacterium]